MDYKKAYDMVPHSWILRMLNISKVAGNITSFLSNTMVHWKTNLTCNGNELGSIEIKRGIFQGDALSPLLFIISMLPLSFLLQREERLGFRFGSFGQLINHLFFMDDLKLHAKNEHDLKKLVDIVHSFSVNIGFVFGIEKCASLKIEAGVRKESDGISLPTGEVIREVENDGNKYLGVLEGCDIEHKKMKELVTDEYLRRVKSVARSKLYSRNLFNAVNSWAVSVVRYSAGILNWKENELKSIDVKTRKILTMNGI